MVPVKRLRDMRRTLAVAALAACGGFCLASATALGGVRLDVWRDFGEKFQIGYIIGYLDAASLAKRHDMRVLGIPTGGKANFERWRAMVNEFYVDPAHANARLSEAMGAVGKRLQEEMLKAGRERTAQRPLPGASPAVAGERAAPGPTSAPGASPVPHAPAVP